MSDLLPQRTILLYNARKAGAQIKVANVRSLLFPSPRPAFRCLACGSRRFYMDNRNPGGPVPASEDCAREA